MFYTSAPIVVYAILDAEFSSKFLCDHPLCYRIGIEGVYFNTAVFWKWNTSACIQAFLIAYSRLIY